MTTAAIVWICLMSTSLLLNAMSHGKPRTGKYHVGTTLIGLAIQVFILLWGGFFK